MLNSLPESPVPPSTTSSKAAHISSFPPPPVLHPTQFFQVGGQLKVPPGLGNWGARIWIVSFPGEGYQLHPSPPLLQ